MSVALNVIMCIFLPSVAGPLVLPQLSGQESYPVRFASEGKYPVSGYASAICFQHPENSADPFQIRPKVTGKLFRANILKMVKKGGRINDELIEKIMKWNHNSGFLVHNGVHLSRDEEASRES